MNGNQNGILSHSNGYKEADSLGFPVNDFGNTNVHDNREDPLACDRKDGNKFWKVPELDDSIFFDNNNEIKASNVRDNHNVDLSTINGDNRGGNPFACDIPSSETNEIVAASVTDDQTGSLSNIIHTKRGGNPFACDIPSSETNEIVAASVTDDLTGSLSNIIHTKRGGNPFACDIPSSETNEIVAASVTDDQTGSLSNIIHTKRGGNPFECDTKDRNQPWNIPEYESLNFLDDKGNETIDSDSPFTSHSKLFENNKHFYSDKGVTDHELSELTVCYRDNNFNIVKDICMDEGVPAVDKVLTESWKDDQLSTSVSVDADEEHQSNAKKSVDMGSSIATVSQDSSCEDAKNIAVTHDAEIEPTGAPIPNDLNPSLENKANKDADKDSYLEDLLMIFGSKCTTNGKTTNASEKPSSPNTVVRVEESNIKTSDGDQSALQPDQVPFDQTLKSQTAISAADESNNKGNSKEGAGTSIFDFNLTKPESTTTTEGGVENLPEDSHKPKAVSVHKNGNSDNISASSQVPFANTADNAHQQHLESQNMANGQGHFADGEASFSAARGPISGSITYSGPISYSGSLSLRSESSTTSTRSFAFPVLQNEWNSSPVRMAKAERRRLSKQKGWKQGLLCCRF